MALSYYSSKPNFLRQIVLDRNMKNNHKILEKTSECEPYEFAKVNTISLCLTTTFIHFDYKFWNMFEHQVLVLHEN